MDLFVDIVVLLATCVGLGGLLPALCRDGEDPLGLRVFAGFCLLGFSRYVLIVIFGAGFDLTFALVSVAALGGLARLAARHRYGFAGLSSGGRAALLLHPVVLLPAIVGSMLALAGPLVFWPYGDDTYVNWLSHAKQLWLADAYWIEGMRTGARGYLPGWHLLIAHTPSMWQAFSDLRALAVPAVFHIALLCLVYDVTRNWLRDRLGFAPPFATLYAMAFILFALAIEASWRLLPTLILSEMPLFYSLIGFFVLSMLFAAPGVRVWPLTLALAVVLACHYLIKSQGLALLATGPLLVAAGVMMANGRIRYRDAVAAAVLVLVPAALVFVSWNLVKPPSAGCVTELKQIFQMSGAGPSSGPSAGKVFQDLAAKSAGYLAGYKLPLSLLAVLGLLAGLFHGRLRWISLGMLVYAGVYFLAVFLAYFGCPDSFNSYFSSLFRYLQPPVRGVHFVGVLVLALVAAEGPKRFLGARGRRGERPLKALLAAGVIVLAAAQFWAVSKSIHRISHPDVDAKLTRYIKSIPDDVRAIVEQVEKAGLRRPKLLMSFVFWEHLPALIADHYGYGTTRAEYGAAGRWTLAFTRYAKADSASPSGGLLRFEITDYDIIWVKDESAAFKAALAGHVSDAACASRPARYLFLRRSLGDPQFDCLAWADIRR